MSVLPVCMYVYHVCMHVCMCIIVGAVPGEAEDVRPSDAGVTDADLELGL